MTVFWDVRNDGIAGPATEGETYLQHPWDRVILGGHQLPGLVQVTVPSKPRRLQNNKHNGADGATPIFRGLETAQVGINIVIWTPDQLSEWDRILPDLFPSSNKDANKLGAKDISHPATSQRGVNSIIIVDIDGPNPGPVYGSKQYSLRCIEYKPADPKKKQNKKLTASAPNVNPHYQQRSSAGKNAPKKPSQGTDFSPNQSIAPQQGSS